MCSVILSFDGNCTYKGGGITIQNYIKETVGVVLWWSKGLKFRLTPTSDAPPLYPGLFTAPSDYSLIGWTLYQFWVGNQWLRWVGPLPYWHQIMWLPTADAMFQVQSGGRSWPLFALGTVSELGWEGEGKEEEEVAVAPGPGLCGAHNWAVMVMMYVQTLGGTSPCSTRTSPAGDPEDGVVQLMKKLLHHSFAGEAVTHSKKIQPGENPFERHYNVENDRLIPTSGELLGRCVVLFLITR